MQGLPSPNLDDRDFEQLMQAARERIARAGTTWSAESPSDPGVVMLEAFAHLVDILLYRVNRIPEKVHVELLRLLGTVRRSTQAAGVTLRFVSEPEVAEAITVPAGTLVTAGDGTAFMVTAACVVPPGGGAGTAFALHATRHEMQMVGRWDGTSGATLTVPAPPIIEPAPGAGLLVAVATAAATAGHDPGVEFRRHGDRSYRVLRELEHAWDVGPDELAFVAHRRTGSIRMVAGPQVAGGFGGGSGGLPVRVSYHAGGGAAGNIAAGSIDTLVEPIVGLAAVEQPGPATGGLDEETVAEAVVRGPATFHERSRAVTSADYEAIVSGLPAIAAVRATARGHRWAYAIGSGIVDLNVLPSCPDGAAAIDRAALVVRQTPDALERARAAVRSRQPLGVRSSVRWAEVKPVRVRARIIARPGAEPAMVQEGVRMALDELLRPVPRTDGRGGRAFGGSLHRSAVMSAIVNQPGVSHVERLILEEPDLEGGGVDRVAADPFEAGIWYAGGETGLFRSENDGRGWERLLAPEEGTLTVISAHDEPRASARGRIACVIRPSETTWRVLLSEDHGERWREVWETDFEVDDLAWQESSAGVRLWAASDKGLYVIRDVLADPSPTAVRFADQPMPTRHVACIPGPRDRAIIAVTVRGVDDASDGLHLSAREGVAGSFRHVRPGDEEIASLAVQRIGGRTFLWVGMDAPGAQSGSGFRRAEINIERPESMRWEPAGSGWRAGGARCVVFDGNRAVAGTVHGGIGILDAADGAWRFSDPAAGLPRREGAGLAPVDAVAARMDPPMVLAAAAGGLRRSVDVGARYVDPFDPRITEEVTIPPDRMICPAEHVLDVTLPMTAGHAGGERLDG